MSEMFAFVGIISCLLMMIVGFPTHKKHVGLEINRRDVHDHCFDIELRNSAPPALLMRAICSI